MMANGAFKTVAKFKYLTTPTNPNYIKFVEFLFVQFRICCLKTIHAATLPVVLNQVSPQWKSE
jgi:hypothetical protein